MRKIGIYGGSFSPPHLGHVKSAKAFYDGCGLDELIVMPAGIPPHKQAITAISSEDRLLLCKTAFADGEGGRRITVSDYEIKKRGLSFTCETLRHFASRGVRLYFLMGSDMFLSLDTWKRPDLIFKYATVVVNRRETDLDATLFTEKKAFFERKYGAKILLRPFEPLEISSSEVRDAIANGANTDRLESLVGKNVLEEILKKDLFKAVSSTLSSIREQLPDYCGPRRLGHVLSVEEEVRSMARYAELDAKDLFILRKAALLHDVTHERTKEEQIELSEKLGCSLSRDDLASLPVLHQFTGAAFAASRFGLEAAGCDAIRCHTTGKPAMTVPEMILCLGDYIEKTRPYPACMELRSIFYNDAGKGARGEELLCRCMRVYLETTVSHLREKGCFIHPQTLEALNYYNQFTRKDQ